MVSLAETSLGVAFLAAEAYQGGAACPTDSSFEEADLVEMGNQTAVAFQVGEAILDAAYFVEEACLVAEAYRAVGASQVD